MNSVKGFLTTLHSHFLLHLPPCSLRNVRQYLSQSLVDRQTTAHRQRQHRSHWFHYCLIGKVTLRHTRSPEPAAFKGGRCRDDRWHKRPQRQCLGAAQVRFFVWGVLKGCSHGSFRLHCALPCGGDPNPSREGSSRKFGTKFCELFEQIFKRAIPLTHGGINTPNHLAGEGPESAPRVHCREPSDFSL